MEHNHQNHTRDRWGQPPGSPGTDGGLIRRTDRHRRRRHGRPSWFVLLLAGVTLAGLVLAMVVLQRRGDAAAETPVSASGAALSLVRIDPALSQQVQSGQLALAALPAGKIAYFQAMRDPEGNLQRDYSGRPLRVAWVADDPPLVDAAGVEGVDNPGSDDKGTPRIVVNLTGEGQEQLRAQDGCRVALVAAGELWSMSDVPAGVADSVGFSCGWAEARTLSGMFAPAGPAG